MAYIRAELIPKELKLPLDELTFDGEVEILERTMIRRSSLTASAVAG